MNKLERGNEKILRVVTLDVKYAFNSADWEHMQIEASAYVVDVVKKLF